MAHSTSAQAQRIRVTGLEDINLGLWNGFVDLTGTSRHCVGGSPRALPFGLRASGMGKNGSFELSNGVSQLPYHVRYNDGLGSGWVALLANQTHTGFGSIRFSRCRRQQIAQLRIIIRRQALSAASAGRYGGLIALTVVPE